jgi:NADH dehydrogenase (ubiquinone) 1 beta subcomplex subunit 9
MAHRLTRTEKLLALAHIPIRQPALSELPHKQRVLRLYRRLLKEYLNWAGNRKIWYHGAGIIKTLFKNNMHETDPARVKKLVEEAEHVLVTFAHPAPYIIPYAPGGTLYQRNTPVPFEVCPQSLIFLLLHMFLEM